MESLLELLLLLLLPPVGPGAASSGPRKDQARSADELLQTPIGSCRGHSSPSLLSPRICHHTCSSASKDDCCWKILQTSGMEELLLLLLLVLLVDEWDDASASGLHCQVSPDTPEPRCFTSSMRWPMNCGCAVMPVHLHGSRSTVSRTAKPISSMLRSTEYWW